ncbi:DUF4339 domain-containing protein [Schlesneria paludicola]|uniref:DUF4339 domain-containing protein n=1 Tax=Schlesneria paludicola TaxID=360056 RepID=UPI00031598BC|nr:DUF4339 domain-containing protein [Schlesneria paludicola]
MSHLEQEDGTVHWYYRTGEKVVGPVLLSRLRQMVRKGTLTSDDFVRKGKTGTWVGAGTVNEIDAHAPVVHESATEPEASPTVVAPFVPRQNRLYEWAASWSEWCSDLAFELRLEITDRLGMIRSVSAYLVLAVTIVFLLRVTVTPSMLNWSSPADPYETIHTVWKELDGHRTAHANDATWQEFTQRGSDQLKPVIARLEREAASTNRPAQLMLWASRDCLPKMFHDARSEPSQTEAKLTEYIRNVDRLRKGEPIYGGNLGGYRPRTMAASSLLQWFIQEPVTAAMAVLLTTANLAIVAWLFKGLLNRKSGRNSTIETT